MTVCLRPQPSPLRSEESALRANPEAAKVSTQQDGVRETPHPVQLQVPPGHTRHKVPTP